LILTSPLWHCGGWYGWYTTTVHSVNIMLLHVGEGSICDCRDLT
jgi:hypothetical protein